MRSTFTFNGHKCDEFGIYISKKPNINRSQRKFQSASVAGRNGNIYQFQDAWDEVVVTYDIFAGGYEQGDAPRDFTAIMEWLNSADDYARLEDSFDEDHYRMAVFVDATNIEQKWYSTGQAQIKFRCKPQHYLVGEVVSVEDGDTITNPTNHVALPIITLEGAGVRSILHLDGRVQALPSAGTTFTYRSLSTFIPTRETLTYLVKKDTPNHPNTIIITGGARGTMTAIDDEEGKIEFNVINQEGAESWGIGIIKEVQGNSEYSISCEAYNDGQLIVMFADGSGYNSLTGEAEVSASGSGWIPLSLSFKTPTECGYILIMFIRKGQDPVTDLTQKFRKIMLNTGNTAQPFRPYEAQSVSEITINGTTLKFTEHGFSEAVIDCERENFIMDSVENNIGASVLDQYGNLSVDYLKLDKGENQISFSEGITSVSVDCRFWEL